MDMVDEWKVQDKYISKNFILKFILNKFRKDVIKLVKLASPNSILDIGCGEGFIIREVADNFNAKITAVDIEKEAIEYAKKNSQRKNIDYCVGNIFKLNYKNNSFDLVMGIEVFEHLKEFEVAFEIVSGLTKKYLLISVPNEPWFRIANVLRLKYLKDLGNTPGHVNNWTKKEFKKLCSKYGKIVKLKTSTFWNMALINIRNP